MFQFEKDSEHLTTDLSSSGDQVDFQTFIAAVLC